MSQCLRVFGRLRGLSKQAAEEIVNHAAQALRLDRFMEQQFEHLSGGTKRKVRCLPLFKYEMNLIFTIPYKFTDGRGLFYAILIIFK